MAILCDNAFLRGISAASSGGYVPAGAIWLDGSADYLSKTFSGAPDSNQILTLSYWIKRSRDGADGILGTTTAHYDRINHGGEFSGSQVALTLNAAATTGQVTVSPAAREDRDYTAWMHVVVAIDTTQGTSTNRCKFYINGVAQTTYEGTVITLNETFGFLNSSTATFVGKSHDSSQYANCYLTDVIVIDGYQLDETSFGEFDANGNWVPIDPSGLTFGTNGFWLNFSDSTNLGKDAHTTQTKIAAATGTAIGNMTSGGGLAASFNDAIEATGADSRVSGDGNIGKDWGASNDKTITGFEIFAPSDNNFGGSNITFTLKGSATGAFSGEEVTLYSSGSVAQGGNGWSYKVDSGITTTTAYRYHKIFMSSGAGTQECSELVFYEGGGDIGNNFFPTSVTSANSTSDRPADDAENDLGNYATWNPNSNSYNGTNGTRVFSNGNKTFDATSGIYTDSVRGTIATSSGKWYWEIVVNGVASPYPFIGVSKDIRDTLVQNGVAIGATGALYEFSGSSSGAFTSFTTSDVIGFALDQDNGALWIRKNGTWMNGASTSEVEAGTTTNAVSTHSSLSDGTLFHVFASHYNNTGGVTLRNETSEFGTAAPTGFKALNTANLPAPTVTDPSAYFNTVLYTGTDAIQSVTGVGFQPDLVWIKTRSNNTTNHQLYDVIRAAPNYLYPNLASAQQTLYSDVLTSFDSDGFSLGADASSRDCNYLGRTYVAWCLKAGGAGSSNTDGSITSTVSAAAHRGFSIGTYTGTGASATVGHGLSSAPAMIIVKDRDAANEWSVYHSALGPGKDLQLESSANVNTNAALWNNTAPTASVFSVSTIARQNASGNSLVFYAFAKTPGLIGIGSYVGNGSTDGPYVVVDDGGSGFRPAFLMYKNTAITTNWTIIDAARNPYNVVNTDLYPNTQGAEYTGGGETDFTANGFKVRASGGGVNGSGNTIIYLAFAEYPFGGDGVAQAKAR